MTNKKKTNIDVFEAIIHMAMGQYGRVAVHEFWQTVLPKLKLSPFAYKELSDTQFDEAMALLFAIVELAGKRAYPGGLPAP